MDIQPVFISTLTAHRKHLLLVSEDEGIFSRLADMITQSNLEIDLISDDFPFLVNLTCLENIVLGCMYHNSMDIEACREMIQPAIDRLHLAGSLNQRPQFLSRPQLLKMQLLRCIANDSIHIFLPMASRSDCDILDRAVANLEISIFLWVACLSNNLDGYTSLEYTIIDLNALQ